MSIEFSKSAAYLANAFLFQNQQPSITGFTRLETQPTTLSLKTGLQAPLADPLWMLARQWQFNEFQGEDAGTPIKLAFSVQGTRIDQFRAGHGQDQPWLNLADSGVPIETRIEAEPVWQTHPRLCGEAGLHLLRMLPNAVTRDAVRTTYPLRLAEPGDPRADHAGILWATLFDQRSVDARALVADLIPLIQADGQLAALPATLSADALDADALRAVLQIWLVWLDDLVFEGDADNPAWRRERMEYAFALRGGNVVLAAEEYTDGHLDWEDFRATNAAEPAETEPTIREFAVGQRLPSPVRYPGMPAERYWEFEDGRVNFAGAEAGVTDLLRLSVTEFALTFGNDWFLTPVRLPVGWLYQVSRFEITDTFGITAQAEPLKTDANAPWSLFRLSAEGPVAAQLKNTVFIADSLDGIQEGAVLEHTLLVRDEMANLAWAIEKTVQGSSGEPLDRDMEAKALAFRQQLQFDKLPDSPQLLYRLVTPVPANWTPLLPIRRPGLNLTDPLEIQLERAGMKRFYPQATVAVIGSDDPDYDNFLATLDDQPNFITPVPMDEQLRAYVFYPRGWLLRRNPNAPFVAAGQDADRLILEEEEVPRIGASLKRKFQYARSSDGRSWLWIGRSKTAGRGEARSNLRYDVTEKSMTAR